LPTEGVDRNCYGRRIIKKVTVALPTEGVDRNQFAAAVSSRCTGRPPHGGRGQKSNEPLWIKLAISVALPTEGVDRNTGIPDQLALFDSRRPPHGGRG